MNQVTTPTLTLPRQGGGDFKGALLFPLPGANPYPQIEGRLGMVALEKALGVSL